MNRSFGATILAIVFATMLLGAQSMCNPQKQEPVPGDGGSWCQFGMAAGNSARNLGPQDMNAGYIGFLNPVREGERAVFRGKYPHARYMTIVLYDENFRAIDALTDYQIEPLSGENPFRPGVDRSAKDLGEFEVQVLMTDPPAERETNTLYAGKSFKGGKNSVLVFGYRIYLPDAGYGQSDGNPLGIFGGVEPPKFRMEDAAGNAYCPKPNEVRKYGAGVMGSIVKQNSKLLTNPQKIIAAATNPLRWHNEYSRATRRDNTVVGNEDTIYINGPVSNKYGQLLVLRFKAPNTPVMTHDGSPFPAEEDMRYFSLSFAYLDRSTPFAIATERTVADYQIPKLPDGTSQAVIGFGGMAKPASVPADQWVGLKMKEGLIIVRYILTNPDYKGDLGQVDRGWIPKEWDQYTPGGVYCSVEEFANNPDIGLTRAQIIK